MYQTHGTKVAAKVTAEVISLTLCLPPPGPLATAMET